MPRAERIWFPGAIYHIIQRGNAQQKIFKEKGDYEWFLKTLREVKKETPFNLFCYILMGNHYHMTIETRDHHISEIMHSFNSKYAMRFNTKHRRKGHLFQGRFKGILVEKDSYLLELSRYIHLNPVKAGLAKAPDNYLWSSYSVYNGHKTDPLVDSAMLLGLFEDTAGGSQSGYCAFVNDGLKIMRGERDWLEEHVRRQRFLGGKEFIEKYTTHRGKLT